MFKKIFKNKWTVYLLYNGICVKKINVKDYSQINTRYVHIFGHKKMFGKNIVGVLLKPVELLKTDEKDKKIYIGTTFERGVDF